MKKCFSCLLPETHETIEFDNSGVCNICNQHKVKNEKIDWSEKKKELDCLIEDYRGKYDYSTYHRYEELINMFILRNKCY